MNGEDVISHIDVLSIRKKWSSVSEDLKMHKNGRKRE